MSIPSKTSLPRTWEVVIGLTTNEPFALYRIEVPGGWLYITYDTAEPYGVTSNFVPLPKDDVVYDE